MDLGLEVHLELVMDLELEQHLAFLTVICLEKLLVVHLGFVKDLVL